MGKFFLIFPATCKLKLCLLQILSNKVSDLTKMIAIVSKISFFTSASRAVNITTTRNIYTKEYLGLSFRQKKREEAHGKAGKNVMKIKKSFMTSYERRGIKNLKKNDILN